MPQRTLPTRDLHILRGRGRFANRQALRDGLANPVATFWTASMMLEHLGEADAARRLMRAIESVTGAGIQTPDLGGRATTADVTAAVREALASSSR